MAPHPGSARTSDRRSEKHKKKGSLFWGKAKQGWARLAGLLLIRMASYAMWMTSDPYLASRHHEAVAGLARWSEVFLAKGSDWLGGVLQWRGAVVRAFKGFRWLLLGMPPGVFSLHAGDCGDVDWCTVASPFGA